MRYGKTYTTILNFSSSSLCVCVRALVRSRRTTLQQNRRCYHCLFHRHHRSSTFRARDTLFSVPSAFSPRLLFSFFCRCRVHSAFHNLYCCVIKVENMLVYSLILSKNNVHSMYYWDQFRYSLPSSYWYVDDDNDSYGELFSFIFVLYYFYNDVTHICRFASVLFPYSQRFVVREHASERACGSSRSKKF